LFPLFLPPPPFSPSLSPPPPFPPPFFPAPPANEAIVGKVNRERIAHPSGRSFSSFPSFFFFFSFFFPLLSLPPLALSFQTVWGSTKNGERWKCSPSPSFFSFFPLPPCLPGIFPPLYNGLQKIKKNIRDDHMHSPSSSFSFPLPSPYPPFSGRKGKMVGRVRPRRRESSFLFPPFFPFPPLPLLFFFFSSPEE